MEFRDVENNTYYQAGKIRVGIDKRNCKICGKKTLFKRPENGHFVCSSECYDLDEQFDKE